MVRVSSLLGFSLMYPGPDQITIDYSCLPHPTFATDEVKADFFPLILGLLK